MLSCWLPVSPLDMFCTLVGLLTPTWWNSLTSWEQFQRSLWRLQTSPGSCYFEQLKRVLTTHEYQFLLSSVRLPMWILNPLIFYVIVQTTMNFFIAVVWHVNWDVWIIKFKTTLWNHTKDKIMIKPTCEYVKNNRKPKADTKTTVVYLFL